MTIDVGSLTLDESKSLFAELITILPLYHVRDILMDSLTKDDLEELEMACQEKIQEFNDEEAIEEEDEDEENEEDK